MEEEEDSNLEDRLENCTRANFSSYYKIDLEWSTDHQSSISLFVKTKNPFWEAADKVEKATDTEAWKNRQKIQEKSRNTEKNIEIEQWE